ncbi:MAG: acyl--CoA ligase [Paludibacteraceae bacterium]|nr:acyl--CoA ligase [Paludibacteraceae bacterium]
MNLIKFLETSAKNFIDKIAIAEENEEITYRELWEIVNKMAKAFLDIGVKEGDRIAICLPNCKEYIYAFLAALKINAIAVPLKQVITSYEMKAILKDCHPALLITDNVFVNRMLPFDPIIGIGKVIICSKRIIRKGSTKRAVKIESLIKDGPELGTTISADGGTVASINYTYRGYGYPLGAMLTHKNFKAGSMTYINTTGITPDQKILLALPMSHVYSLIGCVTVPLLLGCSIVIMKRSDPKATIKLINSLNIDVITSVPTFYLALLKANEKQKSKLHNVQHCFSGGSLLQLSAYQEVKEKMGWDIRQGYGLTECLPVTCNPSFPNNPASIGRIGVGAMVKVVDESGNDKKTTEIGEIVAGGDSIMTGYYNHPKETKEVLKDGWCYTGDYGYFDNEGYLYFTGLKKRITKVGGNMVDMEEVRKTIRLFPGIVEANIEAMGDEFWGHILTAEVSVRNLKEFNARKLRSFLRDRLVSYKIPHIKKVSS